MIEDLEQRKKIERVFLDRVARAHRYLAYTAVAPFAVAHASASTVYDAFEAEYLDFSCAGGTAPFGHGFTPVLSAVTEHARYHHNTSEIQGEHLAWPVIEYAAALAESFPGQTDLQVAFAPDEQTALREAVRLACAAQGKDRILVVAGDNLWLAQDYPDRVDVLHPGKMILGEEWWPYGCVVLSPMTSHGEPLHPQWRDDLLHHAARGSVPAIVNESRTGYGRTGPLWAQNDWETPPSHTVLGGPGGGGFPFGAIVAHADWFAVESRLPPLSGDLAVCRTGLALFEQFSDRVLAEGARLGGLLATGLDALAAQFPDQVVTRWGAGMWQSLVLPSEQDAQRLVAECLVRGLMLAPARGATVSLTPALTIPEIELSRGLDLLAAVLMRWSEEQA